MFCLSGNTAVQSCEVFPPFDVSDGNWEIGLVDLSTYNSIPNIENNLNDTFYYADKSIKIDEGSYEIEDLEKYIIERIDSGVGFSLKPNNNTLKAEIKCSAAIDFTKSNSIGALLGFNKRILEPNTKHSSDKPVNIIKVNTVVVECNLVRGAYDNGRERHVLHEFYPMVEPGYKIVELPNPIIYLPLTVQRIDNITVSLKDQDGNLINFRGEKISLRINVRKSYGFGI